MTHTITSAVIETVTVPSTGCVIGGGCRIMNIPYSATEDFQEAAITWFGAVGTSTNYSDVRVVYSDDSIAIWVAVIDSRVWEDETPNKYEYLNWDGISLYIDTAGNANRELTPTMFNFNRQLQWWADGLDESRKIVYQGSDAGWVEAALPFTAIYNWYGNAPNDDIEDRAYFMIFTIPYTSLGVTKPHEGTKWGLGVMMHDRDDVTGAVVTHTPCPDDFDDEDSRTWIQLSFGLPNYITPPIENSQVITLRNGVNGITVKDGSVGGQTDCADPLIPDYFALWGDRNLSGTNYANIQNQGNTDDWPCFSKYYLSFPLGSLPSGKTISEAVLTMYRAGEAVCDPDIMPSCGTEPPSSVNSLVQVMVVDSDFEENTITWNNAPIPMENVSQTLVLSMVNLYEENIWDLSRAANEAYQAGKTALNIVLYCSDEYGPHGKYYYTGDEYTATHRPKLDITIGDLIEEDSWEMPGANSERSSWVAEEVSGMLYPEWYKQFESYIPPHVQIIAKYGTLYISTANGLYAIDADTGAEIWVYPTELPLGNSPAVIDGVVYVGGFDKMLHAVDAFSGKRIWTYVAGAGFDTSPIVEEGLVMLGNRDGYFYAINASTGLLEWRYQTGGAVSYSAAYKDGDVYFASQDMYAYALDATDGSLEWKSDKILGAGLMSWWPVIYEGYVIFVGSVNYRVNIQPGPGKQITSALTDTLFPNNLLDVRGVTNGPIGTEAGDWVLNTRTMDVSTHTTTVNGDTYPVTEYIENNPEYRTYIVLDRDTGVEFTTDIDSDSDVEYAPITFSGTQSGNRYPPIIGSDGVLYQTNPILSSPYICGAPISGWKFGTQFVSEVSSYWYAIDEPRAYSAGGNLIYWNLCLDREGGSFDITKIYGAANREWKYYDYNLNTLIPGYSLYTNGGYENIYLTWGGDNGEYGLCNGQNPPIPYNGKVYMHRGNCLVAWITSNASPTFLPIAHTIHYRDPELYIQSVGGLETLLSAEVQKIITAGHLKPGFHICGTVDLVLGYHRDYITDYWHNPGEILIALLQARPYLSVALQGQLDTYLQAEFVAYPPYSYNHIGWQSGAAREPCLLPPSVSSAMATMAPSSRRWDYAGWNRNPIMFYAMWKYAAQYGGALAIYNASSTMLDAVPADSLLAEYPYVHNCYIAGYLGFLELESLAGHAETASVRTEYNRILALRASAFDKDIPAAWLASRDYLCTLSVARNFMFMTPELSTYLHDNIYSDIETAVEEYEYVAPYWIKAKHEASFGESGINHLLDYGAMFAAKAILQQSYVELAKCIDVPACLGDLYYIQNLVLAIEKGSA